jgi:1-acyl-sn-glycerol-3-phosphate acyltransferase
MYRWVYYPLAKLFLRVTFFLLGPVSVAGRQNVPQTGGVLILANHISDADPPVMGVAVPRRPWFMAKSELFAIPVLGSIIRGLHAYPVDRGEPDRAALRKTISLLQAGDAVVMFPEGQISEDGEPQPLLPGAALIARSAGVPVVCAGIVGTDRIIPFKKIIPRPAFGGVHVRFGTPASFPKEAKQEEILDWVRGQFAALTLTPGRSAR